MKNKLLYNLIFIIIAVSVCFSFLSLSATAQSLTDELIEFSCAEPPADSNNGYMIIYYKTSTDKILGRLIAWSIVPTLSANNGYIQDEAGNIVNQTDTFNSLMDITINPSDVRFTPKVSSHTVGYYSIIDVISDTNELNGSDYNYISPAESHTYKADFAGNTILGYSLYGNGYLVSNTYPARDELYPVLFNEGKTQYNQMLQIINMCQQFGIQLDGIRDDILWTNSWLESTYMLLESDLMYYLYQIETYTYQTQQYLLQCKELLEEIRDSLNISGPSFDEVMGDDEFGDALGDYNTNDAVSSLPNQFEGDKVSIYSGIGFFTKIYDNLLHYMPELNHAITFILTISFVGYVLGRKLNKEG